MSKQKTPLAELIEQLEKAVREINKFIAIAPHLKDTLDGYIACMKDAKKLLPKEREVIINAFDSGIHSRDEDGTVNKTSTEYFNEVFYLL